MADKETDKRLKLTITEVKERQPVGDKGAVKLAFKAKGEDGEKELLYFTFSSRLFEAIEKGGQIECDVNISSREYDGNTYIDRKVIQIYVDGQPVGGQQKAKGGYYQDSPEKIASIEAQKRADIIAQLWIADKFNADSDEVKKLRAWLMVEGTKGAKPEVKEQSKTKKPEVKQEPIEDIFPDEKVAPAPKTEAKKTDSTEPSPTDKLLIQVTEAKGFKSTKTARSYLVKSLHIEESRIDSEPSVVWEEIKPYFA